MVDRKSRIRQEQPVRRQLALVQVRLELELELAARPELVRLVVVPAQDAKFDRL